MFGLVSQVTARSVVLLAHCWLVVIVGIVFAGSWLTSVESRMMWPPLWAPFSPVVAHEISHVVWPEQPASWLTIDGTAAPAAAGVTTRATTAATRARALPDRGDMVRPAPLL